MTTAELLKKAFQRPPASVLISEKLFTNTEAVLKAEAKADAEADAEVKAETGKFRE